VRRSTLGEFDRFGQRHDQCIKADKQEKAGANDEPLLSQSSPAAGGGEEEEEGGAMWMNSLLRKMWVLMVMIILFHLQSKHTSHLEPI
jgi:hypothetical protein